jgi:hypothetical protein
MRFLCFCWRLWHRCWRHWFTLRPPKGLCSSCRKRRLRTQPNPSQTCQTSLATGSPCARFLLTLRQRATRTRPIATGRVKNMACPTRRLLNHRQSPCQTCPTLKGTTRTRPIAKGGVMNVAMSPTRRLLNHRQGPCQTCPALIVCNSLLQAPQEERRHRLDPFATPESFLLDPMRTLLRGAHPQQFHQGDRPRLEGQSQS